MTETKTLAAALAAFQAEMPTVPKSQTAKVDTRGGGSYSYTYANLADVSEAAMPLLAKHGLSFSTAPKRTDQGDYELVGTLLHSSGESLDGSLPITGRSAQEIGSSITYGRRYLLGCLTGIVTDDDDDGALAQQSTQPVAGKQQQKQQQRTTSSEPASEKQRGMIDGLMRELGMMHDPATAQAYVADVVGRPVTGPEQLTKAEASALIEALMKEGGGKAERRTSRDDADPWATQRQQAGGEQA